VWLSIGISEIGLVAVLLLLTTALACTGRSVWRWSAAASVAVMIAAAVSPADLLSAVAIGGLIFTVFSITVMLGVRLGRRGTV
jgi:hypothetical protein